MPMHRLNTHSYLQALELTKHDLQVTALIAAAFSKSDLSHLKRLYRVYPLLCLDYFCMFNWNKFAHEDKKCCVKAMAQLGAQTGHWKSKAKQLILLEELYGEEVNFDDYLSAF